MSFCAPSIWKGTKRKGPLRDPKRAFWLLEPIRGLTGQSRLARVRTQKTQSLDGVFEFTARTEFRNRHGWDLDLFASLRITADAGFALRLGEGAETDQSDVFTLLHALLDGVQSGVEDAFSVNFG